MIQEKSVGDYFEVGEDKGWFCARKHPKKWFERNEFVAMCALTRDFGGDYVKQQQMWRISAPAVKAQLPQQPSTTARARAYDGDA